MTRRRVALVGVLLAVVTASVAAALFVTRGSVHYVAGVLVEVRNVDPRQSLRAVTVEVTAATYSLGDLAPGETKSVRVNPTGESSVVIRHAATPLGLSVDCYMEHDYSGSLQVDVTPAKVVKVNNQIGI